MAVNQKGHKSINNELVALWYNVFIYTLVLNLLNDSLECFGIVYCEVCKNLAVNLDACLVESTHQRRITHVLKTCGSIDTLNPQRTERALLVAAVTGSICQTLLPRIFCSCPNILPCSEISTG